MQHALSRPLALQWDRGFIWKIKGQGKRGILNSAICGTVCWLTVSTAYSAPLLDVSFSGDNGQFSTYYSSISNDLALAADKWESPYPARAGAHPPREAVGHDWRRRAGCPS